MPGHWEDGFIKGAGDKSAVGALAQPSMRLVLLARVKAASAKSVLKGFSAKLNFITTPLRQTRTCDQGREMARHQALTQRTGVKVYFCDPHSPWQCGICENTNGLLRQYLPKGTDLSVHSQDDLDAIANQMNNRPRAGHNWRSPTQILAEILGTHAQRSTSTVQ